MAQLEAVVFDFDGVLADTERLHLRAFQETLAEVGIELTPADYAARYLGHADAEVFKGIARDRALTFDTARLQSLLSNKGARYDALVASGAVIIPGVVEKVRAWSALLPLAVASGARRSEIESVLGAASLLSCFVAVVAAEDVTRGKPAPDPYLLALGKINQAEGGRRRAGIGSSSPGTTGDIAATHVVAIEDSPSGLAAINAAGMHAVAVTTNFPADVLSRHAGLVVDSVADLQLDALRLLVR